MFFNLNSKTPGSHLILKHTFNSHRESENSLEQRSGQDRKSREAYRQGETGRQTGG